MIELPADARVVLCDVWGCLHDGVAAFPGAMAALGRWRAEGRIIVLVTNAPRPRIAIARQITVIGVAPDSYDALVTSGDAGLAFVRGRGGDCALIGTAADRAALAEAGFVPTAHGAEPIVVCTGFDGRRATIDDYMPELEAMRARGAAMACFNPDRAVIHGGATILCAGLIADRYAEMGGAVTFTGKPFAPIYDRAFALASRQAGRTLGPADAIAIGDGIATDMAGAAAQGMRFLFVSDGIERQAIVRSGIDAVLAEARDLHDLGGFTPWRVIDAIR